MGEMKFLRLEQVKEKTGLSKTAIYGIAGFPKPIKISGQRASGWDVQEIEQWMRSAIAASRGSGGDQQAA